MNNQIIYILLALTAGIATGETGLGPLWSLIPAGSGIGGFLLTTLMSGNRRLRGLSRLHPLWTVLLFGGVGMFSDSLARPTQLPDLDSRCVRMAGRVEEVTHMETGDRLLLDVSRLATSENIPGLSEYGDDGRSVNMKALVHSRRPGLRSGDIIEFDSKLRSLQSKGRRTDKDYITHLGRKGILYDAIALEKDVILTGHQSDIAIRARQWRSRMEQIVESCGLSADTRGFIITLLTGDKSFTDERHRRNFADAGVSHVLAVSGMHVGIVTSLLLFILYPMKYAGKRKWRYAAVIPLVWIYTWFTGMSPSTVRAAVMISFYFGAIILERRHSSLRALGWAAVLILIVSPRSVFDIGFQLSFLCVGSLIMFVEPLNLVDRHRHPRLYRVNSLILVTLVASLSSWILSSYYFHRIALMFLPANIVAVPLLPLFVALVILYLSLWTIGCPVGLLGSVIDSGYEAFCLLVDKIASCSMVAEDFTVGLPTVLIWISALAAGGLFLNHQRTRRNMLVTIVLFAVAVVSIPLFRQS